MPAVSPPLLDRDQLVTVGSGSKAHVFRPHPNSNLKAFELAEGATVYDIAICGSRGAMVITDEGDADLCGTCTRLLEDAED